MVDIKIGSIEKQILDELFEWVFIENRRVLVVGTPLNGWLPVELAKRSMFTTVIHPDDNRIAEVIVRAREANVDKRMNFFSKHYMEIQFESSGFDSLILYNVLSSFPDVQETLKKCRRELRAGGKFFLLQSVRFGLDDLAQYVGAENARFLTRIDSLMQRIQGRLGFTLLRDTEKVPYAALIQSLERFIQLDHVELRYILSWSLSRLEQILPLHMPDIFKSSLARLDQFERELIKDIPWKFLASSLVVKGSKQLEIGKVFKIRSTRPEVGYF
jgi:ubiquinone/menaquinone biosynthesis C-methylase UbiE